MSANSTVTVPSHQLDEMIRELKKLNIAFNDLSKKLTDTCGSVVRDCKDSSVVPSEPPAQKHGYVNWNSSHDFLKTGNWKPASLYTACCSSKERTSGDVTLYKYHSDLRYATVDKEHRFPEGLHVNESNPHVAAEILYIKEIRFTDEELQTSNKSGTLLSHFLEAVKDHAHTRGSFEEKYGLIWVNEVYK